MRTIYDGPTTSDDALSPPDHSSSVGALQPSRQMTFRTCAGFVRGLETDHAAVLVAKHRRRNTNVLVGVLCGIPVPALCAGDAHTILARFLSATNF